MRERKAVETASATTRQVRAVTDMLIGAAAGALGVWAMDQIGWVMLRHESKDALVHDLQARPTGKGPGPGNADITAQTRNVQTNARAGDADQGGRGAGILNKASQVSGVSSPNQRPTPAAIVFHFSLGMLPGALYGPARRRQPWLGTGHGAFYGLVLFVVMDEVAAPLSGIASAPGRYPWQAHTRGLVAHVALGMVTDTVLRVGDEVRDRCN